MATGPQWGAHGTGRRPWTLALVLVLWACGGTNAGEHGGFDPNPPHFLRSLRPAGGWHPDGGGLLHWWNPQCFPRCGGPDDYCRKPPPNVCWPTYPPYYLWGPSVPGAPHPAGVRNPVGP